LPTKVEGIKVGQKLAKLHLLHSTGWFTDDGTIIGEYVVTWEDDTSCTIPMHYGKDVLDWWFDAKSPEPSDAKIAWNGETTFAQAAGKKVRLHLTTGESQAGLQGKEHRFLEHQRNGLRADVPANHRAEVAR